MTFDFARPEDREQLIELYDLCFPGEHEYAVWFHENVRCRYRTLVYREDGRVVSMIDLIDTALEKNGEQMKAVYLYAVATRPECRGRGIMGEMIEYTFDLLRREGTELAVLLTQNDSLFRFYDRFGFRPVFSVSEVTPNADMPAFLCKARLLDKADVKSVCALYHAAIQGRAAVFRDEERFAEILEEYEGHAYGLFDQQGTLLSYALMDEEDKRAVEVIGYGCNYLLYVCTMDEKSCRGRTLPTGRNDIPTGCARALTDRAEAFLRDGLPPYLNVLYN